MYHGAETRGIDLRWCIRLKKLEVGRIPVELLVWRHDDEVVIQNWCQWRADVIRGETVLKMSAV